MARTTGTHAQGIRLIRLLRRLQGRQQGMRFAELQKEFDVSRSQLRRDLLALEEAGIRLEVDQEHGRYGHARVRLLDADTASIPVTRSERYALLAARGIFDLFRGSQLRDDIESLYEKVMETMPATTRRDTRSLASKIYFRPSGGTKSYAGHEHIIDALMTGLLMERQVRFVYRPRSGRPSTGVMAPYAMVIHRNGLYVIAQRLEDADGNPVQQEPHQYAVERFTEADWIRRSRFDYPEDFDVEDYFDGAFGLISGKKRHQVVVDLGRAVAVDARTRQWHHTQTRSRAPGGGVRIELEVSSLREVIAWVLEWGANARAVGPAELRERVVAELQRAIDNYR